LLRVLITDNDLGDSKLESDLLSRQLEAEVFVRQCRTEDDVVSAVKEINPDAIIVQWAPITESVIASAPNCKVISRIGIGVDMIDLDAAKRAGIPVLNVPHYCTEEVATHAVALAMALWRRLPMFDADVRHGKWAAAERADEIGRLSESTIGLIGMGQIGRLVAKSFQAWGAEILVSDPAPHDDGLERVSPLEIAARSDIISLHAPLLPGTQHIVGPEFMAALRRKPVLINTSRGGLIDPDALRTALESGQLSAAGIDVFEREPLEPTDALRDVPNLLITPHAAWCSREALPELRQKAALNVVEALSTGRR
jgi:D-3-phosphoglycerate dehydrogenase / 2-oxoglutarate reductase